MDTQNPMFENRSLAEKALGMPLEMLVEKRAQKDPVAFNEAEIIRDSELFPQVNSASRSDRKTIMAMQAEMMERRVAERWPAWRVDESYTNLLKQNGLMLDQKASRIVDPSVREATMNALAETTTPANIATVACQLIATVTRAMANNPILGLVGSFNLTQVSGQLIYLDVIRNASCGSYSTNDRIDLQDSPDCWDRTVCTATIPKINARIQRETATATDKAIGADICLPAQQDALSQWGVNLEEFLSRQIMRQMIREWSRNVADDVRTMAGNTGTWSSTIPGPYSALNVNEWRKALFEAIVELDADIRADIYEGAQWMLTGTALGATMRKIKRFQLNAPAAQDQAGALGRLPGEFGTFEDWLSYWEDPFFAASTVLIGRKGSSQVENDFYYWLPYVLLDDVRMLFDPQTMNIHLGGLTRAARKMVEPNAFGRLDVSGSGAAL